MSNSEEYFTPEASNIQSYVLNNSVMTSDSSIVTSDESNLSGNSQTPENFNGNIQTSPKSWETGYDSSYTVNNDSDSSFNTVVLEFIPESISSTSNDPIENATITIDKSRLDHLMASPPLRNTPSVNPSVLNIYDLPENDPLISSSSISENTFHSASSTVAKTCVELPHFDTDHQLVNNLLKSSSLVSADTFQSTRNTPNKSSVDLVSFENGIAFTKKSINLTGHQFENNLLEQSEKNVKRSNNENKTLKLPILPDKLITAFSVENSTSAKELVENQSAGNNANTDLICVQSQKNITLSATTLIKLKSQDENDRLKYLADKLINEIISTKVNEADQIREQSVCLNPNSLHEADTICHTDNVDNNLTDLKMINNLPINSNLSNINIEECSTIMEISADKEIGTDETFYLPGEKISESITDAQNNLTTIEQEKKEKKINDSIVSISSTSTANSLEENDISCAKLNDNNPNGEVTSDNLEETRYLNEDNATSFKRPKVDNNSLSPVLRRRPVHEFRFLKVLCYCCSKVYSLTIHRPCGKSKHVLICNCGGKLKIHFNQNNLLFLIENLSAIERMSLH